MGYIDKILNYRNIEDIYFSINDYKTGDIDTHLEPMKYGLHMQLPVYLYLIHYGKLFSNPIFTGIYYQNILFPYPSWSEKLEKEKKERTYLQGYSTDHVEVLERFDSTYQDSEMIRSMKYSPDKGFGTYSKVLDDETLIQMVDYTKNNIEETTDKILEADFSIHPKIYDGDNVSCKYCSFKDLCYVKERDYQYLDKVEDLSFLGGEE
jgi:ATP-dependent helicase/DNAse subunit B